MKKEARMALNKVFNNSDEAVADVLDGSALLTIVMG
jgi:hypothetical protein